MTFEQVIRAVQMYYWNVTIPMSAQIQLLERATKMTLAFAREKGLGAAGVWYDAADQPGRVRATPGIDYAEASVPKNMAEFDVVKQRLAVAVRVSSSQLGIPRMSA